MSALKTVLNKALKSRNWKTIASIESKIAQEDSPAEEVYDDFVGGILGPPLAVSGRGYNKYYEWHGVSPDKIDRLRTRLTSWTPSGLSSPTNEAFTKGNALLQIQRGGKTVFLGGR